MPVTIDSALGLQQMGESAKLFDMPGPLRLKSFFNPEPCYADVYRFDREDYELDLAPFVGGRTAPAIETKKYDVQPEFISLAHIRIAKTLFTADMLTQRSPGEISDNAAAEIAKIRLQQRNRILLAIERLCAMALRGTITINAANFPDSKVTMTIVRAVTALTAGASWATAATKIISGGTNQLQGWRREMHQAGAAIRRLIFNNTVTRYLLGNTECKEWKAQTARGIEEFTAAQFSGMGGVPNWEEYETFYKPVGGSATPFVADDEVFTLPADEIMRMNQRLIEGHAEIPNWAIGAGGGDPMGGRKSERPGLVEFAVPLTGNVPGVELVTVWYGVPLVKIPKLVGYCADVTP